MVTISRERVLWQCQPQGKLEILLSSWRHVIWWSSYQEVFLHLRCVTCSFIYVNFKLFLLYSSIPVMKILDGSQSSMLVPCTFNLLFVCLPSTFLKTLQALKILEDDMQCDIVKIGNIIRNKVVLIYQYTALVHEIGYMSPSFLWILFVTYYILMLMLSVQQVHMNMHVSIGNSMLFASSPWYSFKWAAYITAARLTYYLCNKYQWSCRRGLLRDANGF